jgi:chromate transporter
MSDDSAPNAPTVPAHSASGKYMPTHRELFLAFLKIGVSAFGGALPWARRVLVEEKGWLGDREFTDILTVCQAVPGPNVVNTSVFIGTHYRGVSGGAISFLGLVGAPFCILLALSLLYHHFAHLPWVKSAMAGMAIVATAYLVSMSLKMAKPFWKNALAVVLCLIATALSAIAHWHMALVLLVCGVVGVVLSKRGKL